MTVEPLSALRRISGSITLRRRFFDPDSHLEAGQYEVTTIFPPDQRLVFSDTSFEEDFVVLVLEQRLGDLCGWMGTRGYYQGWDGLAVWDHIGYPADLTGGQRPTFQGAVAIDSTVPPTILVPVVWGDEDLQQRADIWPGQSGGPFFAWFDSEPWPCVSGVQSGQNPQTNSAGGGSYISNLVNQARTDFP